MNMILLAVNFKASTKVNVLSNSLEYVQLTTFYVKNQVVDGTENTVLHLDCVCLTIKNIFTPVLIVIVPSEIIVIC